MTKKQQNLISMPGAQVWGTVTLKDEAVTKANGITQRVIESEESLSYMDRDTRAKVFEAAEGMTKSLTAACLSLIHDVVSHDAHIIGKAQSEESAPWKDAFAKAESYSFGTKAKPQVWMTCKSTIRRFLRECPTALQGDFVVCTTDGSLNSLRMIKSWLPKKERTPQTTAEKVAELINASEDATPESVVEHIAKYESHDHAALVAALCEAIGEHAVRDLLAKRMKQRRNHLKRAA